MVGLIESVINLFVSVRSTSRQMSKRDFVRDLIKEAQDSFDENIIPLLNVKLMTSEL